MRPIVRSASILSAALLASAGIACGERNSVPDRRIVKAVGLEQSPEGPRYAIEGDPFCQVGEDLLNDAEEVRAAADENGEFVVIADSHRTVGIRALPPFGPDCARRARRALNRLP